MSASRGQEDTGAEGPLSPAETRRALWVAAVAWGVFGSAWLSLITGAPFANFARSLGASTFMFGLAGPFFWLLGLEVLAIGNFWSNVYIMIVPMVVTALTLPL